MGKLFKAVVAAAALGSVCYVFKDKIKATKAYQTLGVDEKVEKVKTTIKDKMPAKEDTERDYFTLADEEPVSTEEKEDDKSSYTPDTSMEIAAEYGAPVATDATSASDVSAKVNDLLSNI